MPTYSENNKFAKDVIDINNLLDITIDWMKKNMYPNDVFEDDTIVDYVSKNFKIEEVFNENEISDYVSKLDICAYFTEDQIRAAAKEIGIVDIQEYRDMQIDKIV